MSKSKKKDILKNEYFLKIKSYLIRFCIIFYVIFMASFIGFHLYYANRTLPNIYINNIYVGGKTFEEVENVLKENLVEDEITFNLKIKNNITPITAEVIGFEFLPVATSKKVFSMGRSGNLTEDFRNKFLSMLNIINIIPEYKYDESDMNSVIKLAKIESLNEVKEPYYEYLEDEGLNIFDGNIGESIDEFYVKDEILKRFKYGFSRSDIEPDVVTVTPTVTKQDLINLTFEINEILKKDYRLSFEDLEWELSKQEVLSFVVPVKKSPTEADLIANKSAILDKLNEISNEVDRNPRGQVLEVENGKAVNFIASEDGRRLVVKDSYDSIEEALFDGQGIDDETKLINLSVEISTPPETSNEYNIEDILGSGTSEFKGSDSGRLYNIDIASQKVEWNFGRTRRDFFFC